MILFFCSKDKISHLLYQKIYRRAGLIWYYAFHINILIYFFYFFIILYAWYNKFRPDKQFLLVKRLLKICIIKEQNKNKQYLHISKFLIWRSFKCLVIVIYCCFLCRPYFSTEQEWHLSSKVICGKVGEKRYSSIG